MKMASALLKKGRVFTQAYSKATTGTWIADGPVYVGEFGDAEALTAHVRAALDFSRQGVPHPSRDGWKLVQKPMLDAVGARNWNELAKGAKAVGLQLEGDVVTLSPSMDYEKEGGTDLPDQEIEVAFGSDDLGRRLIDAVEACR